MIFTTTSLAFIILGIGSGVFCLMFRRAFRKQQDSGVGEVRVGKLISAYFFIFAVSTGIILGLGTLFFGGSPTGLFSILIAFAIGLTILGMLGVYSIAYIFFPKDSPILPVGFTAVMGIVALIALFVAHPQPFLLRGSIDWNLTFQVSMFLFYLVCVSLGSLGYIFVRLFQRTGTEHMKALSLFLAFASFSGATVPFIIQLVFHGLDVTFRTRATDVFLGLLGATLIIFFLTLFFLKNKKVSTYIMFTFAGCVFLIVSFWWATILFRGIQETNENYLFSLLYSIIPLGWGMIGFLSSHYWGAFKSAMGRAVFFISAGVFCWGIGNLIFGYYNLVLSVPVPYPSWGDLFFILLTPLSIIGVIYLFKTADVVLVMNSKYVRRQTFFVVPFFFALLFSALFIFATHGKIVPPDGNFLTSILNFIYLIVDGIIIGLGVTFCRLVFKESNYAHKTSIVFILIGFIFVFIADFLFLYLTTIGIFFVGNVVDLFYPTGFLFIGLGLILLNPQLASLRSEISA